MGGDTPPVKDTSGIKLLKIKNKKSGFTYHPHKIVILFNEKGSYTSCIKELVDISHKDKEYFEKYKESINKDTIFYHVRYIKNKPTAKPLLLELFIASLDEEDIEDMIFTKTYFGNSFNIYNTNMFAKFVKDNKLNPK